MIKAKFRCNSVHTFEQSENVELQAVTNDSEANSSWSQWTPAGTLNMTITNPPARGKINPGQEYYLTLDPVDGANG